MSNYLESVILDRINRRKLKETVAMIRRGGLVKYRAIAFCGSSCGKKTLMTFIARYLKETHRVQLLPEVPSSIRDSPNIVLIHRPQLTYNPTTNDFVTHRAPLTKIMSICKLLVVGFDLLAAPDYIRAPDVLEIRLDATHVEEIDAIFDAEEAYRSFCYDLCRI